MPLSEDMLAHLVTSVFPDAMRAPGPQMWDIIPGCLAREKMLIQQ